MTTMPLAYQALFVPDPRTLKQYANRSDDDHVDDALSTLKDAFDGSSSKTPALAMVPPLLASGIFSKSV
ncbi:hypothetical protein H0E87_026003, partial [Populus deltoides]